MKHNYSVEEKLSVLRLVFEGHSVRSVSDKLHLGHHILYEWLASYKLRGIDGLKPRRKKKRDVPYEEKCRIIREYHESGLTLYQLSAKYDISSSVLSSWFRMVERSGYEALASHRSRPSKTVKRMVKRVPKEEYDKDKEIERLRKENERLRLEVLLLKKVKALVEEREARNRAIGRKSSKN